MAAVALASAATAVVVADRCAIASLVFFGLHRFQKMRRCVARMFFVLEPARAGPENVRGRPFVEADRAHGAGVSPVDKSS